MPLMWLLHNTVKKCKLFSSLTNVHRASALIDHGRAVSYHRIINSLHRCRCRCQFLHDGTTASQCLSSTKSWDDGCIKTIGRSTRIYSPSPISTFVSNLTIALPTDVEFWDHFRQASLYMYCNIRWTVWRGLTLSLRKNQIIFKWSVWRVLTSK